MLGVGAVAAVGLAGGGGASGPAPQAVDTGSVAPAEVDTAALEGPRQPVFFRHDVHAGQFQINCIYCHTYVAESPSAGVPSMQTCRGCHFLIRGSDSANQAEIAKVMQAWDEGRAIEWVRVHSLPQHVHFPHMRHIAALGTDSCVECHGPVERMPQVYQFSSLRMGWCVTCHTDNDVTRDCAVCHY